MEGAATLTDQVASLIAAVEEGNRNYQAVLGQNEQLHKDVAELQDHVAELRLLCGLSTPRSPQHEPPAPHDPSLAGVETVPSEHVLAVVTGNPPAGRTPSSKPSSLSYDLNLDDALSLQLDELEAFRKTPRADDGTRETKRRTTAGSDILPKTRHPNILPRSESVRVWKALDDTLSKSSDDLGLLCGDAREDERPKTGFNPSSRMRTLVRADGATRGSLRIQPTPVPSAPGMAVRDDISRDTQQPKPVATSIVIRLVSPAGILKTVALPADEPIDSLYAQVCVRFNRLGLDDSMEANGFKSWKLFFPNNQDVSFLLENLTSYDDGYWLNDNRTFGSYHLEDRIVLLLRMQFRAFKGKPEIWVYSNVEELVRLLQSNLVVKDRTWHKKRCSECFSGRELVTFLQDTFSIPSRASAVSICEVLQDSNIIYHAGDASSRFVDKSVPFAFSSETVEDLLGTAQKQTRFQLWRCDSGPLGRTSLAPEIPPGGGRKISSTQKSRSFEDDPSSADRLLRAGGGTPSKYSGLKRSDRPLPKKAVVRLKEGSPRKHSDSLSRHPPVRRRTRRNSSPRTSPRSPSEHTLDQQDQSESRRRRSPSPGTTNIRNYGRTELKKPSVHVFFDPT